MAENKKKDDIMSYIIAVDFETTFPNINVGELLEKYRATFVKACDVFADALSVDRITDETKLNLFSKTRGQAFFDAEEDRIKKAFGLEETEPEKFWDAVTAAQNFERDEAISFPKEYETVTSPILDGLNVANLHIQENLRLCPILKDEMPGDDVVLYNAMFEQMFQDYDALKNIWCVSKQEMIAEGDIEGFFKNQIENDSEQTLLVIISDYDLAEALQDLKIPGHFIPRGEGAQFDADTYAKAISYRFNAWENLINAELLEECSMPEPLESVA